jgi:hypothetical protein
MFPSTTDVKDAAGNALVTSYAVRRPDGDWSLLLVNRDASSAHDVRVVFEGAAGGTGPGSGATFAKAVRVTSFGSEQYVWQADSAPPGPSPDGPSIVVALQGDVVTLPKASVTVLRGKVVAP